MARRGLNDGIASPRPILPSLVPTIARSYCISQLYCHTALPKLSRSSAAAAAFTDYTHTPRQRGDVRAVGSHIPAGFTDYTHTAGQVGDVRAVGFAIPRDWPCTSKEGWPFTRLCDMVLLKLLGVQVLGPIRLHVRNVLAQGGPIRLHVRTVLAKLLCPAHTTLIPLHIPSRTTYHTTSDTTSHTVRGVTSDVRPDPLIRVGDNCTGSR